MPYAFFTERFVLVQWPYVQRLRRQDMHKGAKFNKHAHVLLQV